MVYLEEQVDVQRVADNLKGLPQWAHRAIAALVGGEPAPFFLAAPLMAHLRRRGIPVQILAANSTECLQAGQRVRSVLIAPGSPQIPVQLSTLKTN